MNVQVVLILNVLIYQNSRYCKLTMYKIVLLVCFFLLSTINQISAQKTIEFNLGITSGNNDFKLTVNDSLILAVDYSGADAFLIHIKNRSVDSINPKTSYPGFNYMPVSAQLYKNRILFVNGGPWGFTISMNNNDVQILDRFFYSPNPIIALEDKDYFLGFHAGLKHNKPALVKYDYNGIVLDTTYYFDFRLHNILSRLGDYSFVNLGNKILFVNPLENIIYIFNLEGEFIKKSSLAFKKWRKIQSDVKNEDDMEGIFRKLQNSTSLINAQKLNKENDIIVEYYDTNFKNYIHCIIKTEDFKTKVCFETDIRIIGALNNYLFYLSEENDSTFIVGKHLSEFLNQ